MAETMLTLELDGSVPLGLFADSMVRFRKLVDTLTSEVSAEASIAWTVEELSGGSAIATIRGEADELESVERVVRAYVVVGRALERAEVIPYSRRVADAAHDLTRVLNGKITAIRFEAGDDSAVVTTGDLSRPRARLSAFGAVEGRVETLKSRKRKSFTLYDSLNDLGVRCLISDLDEDLLRRAWNKRAIVQGWVTRDAESGRPLEINPVESIEIMPDIEAGTFQRARGIAPAVPGSLSPEETIRRLRDA